MEPHLMIFQTTLRRLASLLVLAVLLRLAASNLFYDSSIASEFYPLVFASVLFMHLRLAFRWKDVAGILLFGALFIVLDVFVLHPHRITLTAWVSFLGMASLMVMSLRAIWEEGEDRRAILLVLIPGAFILGSNFFAGYLHLWTQKAHPKVLDLYLYSFDSSLRIPIVFWLGQAFARWPAFRAISMVFYVGLPFTVALAYAGQTARLRNKAIPIVVAFLITGPLGGIFYNLFPALGPIHLFTSRFPWSPLPAESARRLFLEPVPIAGLRNAIPSLHMAWTLLAWWYSRGLSVWERGLAMAFVVFTIFATMGTGEHYFIDLVVAVPFALFIQALCVTALQWSDSRRWLPLLLGVSATLLWLATLHFAVHVFWISPVLPWAACAATIGFCWLARRGMQDAAVGIIAPAAMGSTGAAIATPEATS
jgi:PAP2 superfamily